MKRPIAVFSILIVAILLIVWRVSRKPSHHETAGDDETIRTSTDRPSTGTASQMPSEKKRSVPVFDETAALRAKVSELMNEREATKKSQERECVTSVSSKCAFLTPSQEILREMARCAVVRADMPIVPSGDPPALETNSPPEVAEISRRFWGEKRSEFGQLYREVLGKPTPPGDLKAMLDEIQHAIPVNVTDEVHRKIARERAGLATYQPPQDLSGLSPAERFWRKRVGLGDDYENALAQKLGPVRARTMRAETDGWAAKAVFAGNCEPPAPGGQESAAP